MIFQLSDSPIAYARLLFGAALLRLGINRPSCLRPLLLERLSDSRFPVALDFDALGMGARSFLFRLSGHSNLQMPFAFVNEAHIQCNPIH